MQDKNMLATCVQIRRDILTMTTAAGSGHPTSSLSAVELMTVLFFSHLKFDYKNPRDMANDRVIFSKGHASPLYYALYKAAGVLADKDLAGYRTFDSVLEGHPTPRFSYSEASTGSLGQGLAIGLGQALALRLAKSNGRVFVLMGDGESAEGSVWEAAAAASYHKATNLFCVVDVNRLGQSDPTMYGYDIALYERRFTAFGWHTVIVDEGNSLEHVQNGWKEAFSKQGPVAIIAKTKKGAGISFLEDKEGWHGKPLPQTELEQAVKELV